MRPSAPERLDIEPPGAHADDSSALHRYGALKLGFAEIVRSVLDRARQSGDEDLESRARQLMVRLAEDRFYLAVVGQHKRGKSSLMNAMIGRELLPTGILPVTSAIVALRYDSALRIQIHQKSSSYPMEIPLDKLPDYVSEQGNPGNRKQVVSAEVGVPVDLLRYGFYFVDTPGIGSAIAANTATTQAFLPEADAAVFVTSFDSPMNELELGFLNRIHQHIRKVFFVINKSDLVSPAQREEVTAFVRQRIGEGIGDAAFRLYIVSANTEIAAAETGYSAARDPGIEELRRDLQTFLVTEKTRECLVRIAQRINNLLESERLKANLVQWTSGAPDARSTAETAINHAAEELIQSAKDIILALSPAVVAGIKERFTAVFGSFRDAQIAAFTESLSKLMYGELFFSPFGLPDELDRLRLSFRSDAAQWLSDHSPEFNDVVHASAASQAMRLAALAPHVLVSASGGVGLTAANDIEESGAGRDPVAELPLSIPVTAPTLPWRWRPPWWCYLLPAPWVANWAIRQALAALHDASQHYEKRLGEVLVASGKRWLHELTVNVEKGIRRRSDFVRETLAVQTTPDASRQIESDLRRVETMVEELRNPAGAAAAGNAATTAESAGPPNTARPCILCRQLSAALSSFLSNYQYELATSHARQLSHAECGGFCSLHTWVYESIASPQGVSAGYPWTLDRVSERLQALANAPPATHVAPEITHILSAPDRCPACRMLDNAEADLITAHAEAVQQNLRPSFCLPHADHVLRALADEKAVRDMIRERAAVFERIAEDMRLFALKTDAVRHYLAVAGEEQAFRRGLQQLVGERNLTMARQVD